MATTLTKEIGSYCCHLRLLRKTIQDTRHTFNEINSAKCFIGASRLPNISSSLHNGNGSVSNDEGDGLANHNSPHAEPMHEVSDWRFASSEGEPVTAEMSPAEEKEIDSVITHPPGFVIFGQSTLARAVVANELLQTEVLPPPVDGANSNWKTVLIRYGSKNRITSIDADFVVVHSKPTNDKKLKPWKVIPAEELEYNDGDGFCAVVEAQLNHPLLEAGARVAVSQTWKDSESWDNLLNVCTRDITPVLIYAIENHRFTDTELEQLKFIKSKMASASIFFVRVPSLRGSSFEASSPSQMRQCRLSNHSDSSSCTSADEVPNGSCSPADKESDFGPLTIYQQLSNLGFLCTISDKKPYSNCDIDSDSISDSELQENFENFWMITSFASHILQRQLVSAVSLMNVVHVRCLESMITMAFNMARDVVCVPPRIKFARAKEEELYNSLMEMAVKNQDEIKRLIVETITSMQQELVEKASLCEISGVEIPESGIVTSSKDLKLCTGQIQEFVLCNLNAAIAGKLVGSVEILRDSYTGVLTRCLATLEQRDLEVAESTKTSLALREILNAAYQVEITVQTNASFVKTLIEKMKLLMHSILWRSPPRINTEWKCKVATDMLATLTETRCQRLAKGICVQIKDRLKRSHHTFEVSLKQLEMRHSGRLEKTEEQRLLVRKEYAPRVARLSLESKSLRDLILYGKPKMGPEVGRGQYGVVFSCDTWGDFGPCAVKTVVPPDDKHWNDLAMEFHYTRNVPEHDRIVALRGSVIDYAYSNSYGPAVLLIMDRLKYDLYTAIERKLKWLSRLQVSIDVVEGIRFLHSQGLVHRDIKLKNVLLDDNDRGKLTDLGFCKPEAMMSGSVVGTPIHMAPELLTGKYDHSVDVYAFGVLFWYVCSGSVHLPSLFERCASKEMLWMAVRKGLRPEKPHNVDPECWRLMLRCWDSNPDARPLVGEIETALRDIHTRYVNLERPISTTSTDKILSNNGDDDSTDSDSDCDDNSQK